MCNYADNSHIQNAQNYFRNAPPWAVIPGDILSRFPFAFQSGRCPKCGRPREMKPTNAVTERSMCKDCYETWIVNRGGDPFCFVCGYQLPDDKIREQLGNRREVSAHIHDDPHPCQALWTVIHNVSCGTSAIANKFSLPPGQSVNALPYYSKKEIAYDQDVVNAQYVTVYQKQFPKTTFKNLNFWKGKPVKQIG